MNVNHINRRNVKVMKPSIIPVGDTAVDVVFENKIDSIINSQIRNLQSKLEQEAITGITGFLAAFRTLTVFYNPMQISWPELKSILTKESQHLDSALHTEKTIVHLPVLYGGEFGPDMVNIEKQSKLSSSEIINLHSQPQYLIYMLGFLPGFAYLGGLDERLATPRLANPRLKINPGSVGIAGTQTGMYPIESPGGWQIIGRTPLQLFQPSADDPFYYSAGDYIKFDAITVSEYQAIQHDVEQHQYQIEVEKEK